MRPEQVKYLCLEGGGGWGFAYGGAIAQLEEQLILVHNGYRLANIRGIAGASAGAMTAMLLTCGYRAGEIDYIMGGGTNFSDFYDLEPGVVPVIPEPGKRNAVAKRQNNQADPRDRAIWEAVSAAPFGYLRDLVDEVFGKDPPPALVRLKKMLSQPGIPAPTSEVWLLLGSLLFISVRSSLGVSKELAHILFHDRDRVIASIASDCGIFVGYEAREFLSKWITIARFRLRPQEDPSLDLKGRVERLKYLAGAYEFGMGRGKPSTMTRATERARAREREGTREVRETASLLHKMAQETYTFQNHFIDFQTKLAVTSSNLETFKSHLFSEWTTPGFPVVDAVRMSMSIPLAFKPIVLHDDNVLRKVKAGSREPNDKTQPHFLRGVWMDGGLFNNTPLGVFDGDYDCTKHPYTLAIRLGVEEQERRDIMSLGDALWAYLQLLQGTGESLISPTYRNTDQCIVVNPKGLSRFDFNPPVQARESAAKIAKEAVANYFANP